MNRFLFLAYIALIFLLTGCYESDYIQKDRMLGDLTTLPCDIAGLSIVFKGESENIGLKYLHFEVSGSKDFGETVLFDCDEKNGRLVMASADTTFFLGKCFYRLVGICDRDTVRASNIVSFNFDMIMRMHEPAVNGNSVGLFCECSSKYYDGYYMISTDPDFRDCTTYRYELAHGTSPWLYYVSVKNLKYETTYYAKLCVCGKVGYVESEVISFTTEDILSVADVNVKTWEEIIGEGIIVTPNN